MLLSTFVSFLRLMWPFIKESILEGGTFKEWVGRNKLNCIWLGLLATMLVIVFSLTDSVIYLRSKQAAAAQAVEVAKVKHTELRERYLLLEASLKLEREKNTTLQNQVIELTLENTTQGETLDRYETWMDKCGINYNYTGSGSPQCKVVTRNTYRPPRRPNNPPKDTRPKEPPIAVPEEEKQQKRKTFGQRLREIFGSGDKSTNAGQ